jgi:hypothetical protein
MPEESLHGLNWLTWDTAVDDSRVLMDLVPELRPGVPGRAVLVEFRIRHDTVEVWYAEHLSSVLDRQEFRAWMRYPAAPMVVDEVGWSVDAHQPHRLVILFPGSRPWVLAPAVEQLLREKI